MKNSSAMIVLLLTPVVLTASCWLTFSVAAASFGEKASYLVGFLFYWCFWCLAVPMKIIGMKNIHASFRRSTVFDINIILALAVPLIFVYGYAFPVVVGKADMLIIALSLVLSVCNAVCEEILWRATYLHVFKDKAWFSIAYSSFGFAIWHYAPQVIVENHHPGGAHSFVAFALVLGLTYSYVASRQQSVLWTTLAHACFDFAGLGASFYFR